MRSGPIGLISFGGSGVIGGSRPPDNRFVDGKTIDLITESSFENRIKKVCKAVWENRNLFGGNYIIEANPLATFASHVVVANSDGDFYRAKYGIGNDGNVSFSEVEKVSMESKDLDSTINNLLKESMLEENEPSRRKKISEAIDLIDLSLVSPSVESVMAEMASLMDSNNVAWKRYLEKNRKVISEQLNSGLKVENRGTAFKKIHEDLNGTADDDQNNFNVMHDNLDKTISRLEGMLNTAYRGFGGIKENEYFTPVIIESFANDFINYVARLYEDLKFVVSKDCCKYKLAEIHDELSEDLIKIEDGFRFVKFFGKQ
jgi:hypothetical protein